VRRQDKAVWSYLAVSLAGVILAAAFLTKPRAASIIDWKLLIWAVFSSLCLLGAMATFFPHRCSPLVVLPEDLDQSRFTTLKGVRLVHGHHPMCGKFGVHEFNVGRKTFCAGCAGLFIGVVAALSVATLYFVHRRSLPASSGYIGLGFVLLGLLYIPFFKVGFPMIRTAVNALFVLGFALVLVAVDGVGSLVLDLIVIGLCSYWMFSRIQLSRMSHDIICDDCDEACDKKGV
jgi:hypothetical protein